MDWTRVPARYVFVACIVLAASVVLLAVQLDQSGHMPFLADEEGILWIARLALAALSVANVVTVEHLVQTSDRVSTAAWERREALLKMRALFFEALAVYGLLLFLLGGHLVDVCVFAAAALALLAWRFPGRKAAPPPAR